MNTRKEVRLYNLLFPIWLLLFIPSWLWLLLIPANYLLDRVVLRWSLGDLAEKGLFCRRHTWKICIAGFFADFLGGALMVGLFVLSALTDTEAERPFMDDLVFAVGFNPFSHPAAFVFVLLAVALTGAVIFLLDRWILKRAGLAVEKAKHAALMLAVITAPYLFFFPSALLYENGIIQF